MGSQFYMQLQRWMENVRDLWSWGARRNLTPTPKWKEYRSLRALGRAEGRGDRNQREQRIVPVEEGEIVDQKAPMTKWTSGRMMVSDSSRSP